MALLLFVAFQFSFAQQPAYFLFGEDQFKGIQVYDIIQDKENNYYISTSEGTYFYDFYHFEKLDDSHLKKSSLFSFKRSKDGNIYCFNINYQICKIKDKKITVFYELLQDEIRSDVSLSLDENDNLFIGAKKIIVLNKSGAVITRHSIHHNYIGKGFNRKDGKIQYSINHTDSIIVYNQGKFEIKKISLPLGNKTSLLEFFQIADSTFAMDLQSKKTYFFNEGTFELSKEISNNLFERIESTRPYEVDGNLWLTGTLPGVSLLKNRSECCTIFYENYYISDVYKDNEGNILLGTFDAGILVIPNINQPDAIVNVKPDLINTISVSEKMGIMMGTSKGKLYSYNKGQLNLILDKSKKSFLHVFENPDKNILIFDEGVIKILDQKTNAVNPIIEASLKDVAFIADTAYLATNIGLFKSVISNTKKISTTRLKQVPNRTYFVEFDDKKENLYVSTVHGLLVFNKYFECDTIKQNNEHIYATGIYAHKNLIYINTKDKGIFVVNKNKVIGNILPIINEKKVNLQKIIFTGNSFIASARSSINLFKLNGEFQKTLYSANEFTRSRIIDFTIYEGNLWISNLNGLQEIKINSPINKVTTPELFLKEIKVNDSAYVQKNLNTFNNAQRKFTFVVSSPTLKNQETIVYHYRLIGYDDEWSINSYSQNEITYNALSSGEYTFEIKAENQKRFSPTLTYSFTIYPPFYEKWWFITLIVALFLAIVFYIYRWQLNIQRKKSEQINELNASKLTAIQSQMNPHFIFNSLNSVQDLILKGDVEHSYTYITTFSNLVRRTLNYSEKDFIDFEQEIKLLELYLSLEKLRFKKDFNYEIIYKDIEDIMLPPLLVQPFIENALVHGLLHKDGAKNLKITFELKELLICTVEDNGVGREKAKAIKLRQRSEHESFSGRAIKKRFEILSNVFDGAFGYEYEDLYENDEGIGTKVTLMIPVKHKF